MSKAERPSEIKQMAGLRLRAVREHFGITQDAMAHLLGVQRTAYANWESGERLADVGAMVRLYQKHGITLEWIFAGSLREMPYDLGEALRAQAGRLGAVVGGPVAEWPQQVERLPGIAGARPVAAVPAQPKGRRTLHEPPPQNG